MKQSQPADRDVDRLRRALREAAPRDEAAVGRADDVVRRGRRSRAGGIASAAAVGLAAAAIVIAPHLIDGSPVTNDASGSSTVSPTDAQASGGSDASPYAHPCPAAPVQVADPPAPRDDLHPDVVMVRLCRAAGGGVASAWQAPADGLLMGVDDFVARVNRLPKSSADPCPTARVAPQPFALLFTDAGGHTQTLSSMFTFCGTVTINFRRVATERLLDVFRQALASQREQLHPHLTNSTLTCGRGRPPVRTSWVQEVSADTEFVAAATCRPTRGGGVTTLRLAPDDIDLLNAEWPAHARDLRTVAPTDRCLNADVRPVPSYVMTAHGDVIGMWMSPCSGNYRLGPFEFLPSKALQKALRLPNASGGP